MIDGSAVCYLKDNHMHSQCLRSHELYLSTLRIVHKRHGSSASTRWQARQGKDKFARDAKAQGLRSRAAFKLLEVILSSTLRKSHGTGSLTDGRSTRSIRYSSQGKQLSIL